MQDDRNGMKKYLPSTRFMRILAGCFAVLVIVLSAKRYFSQANPSTQNAATTTGTPPNNTGTALVTPSFPTLNIHDASPTDTDTTGQSKPASTPLVPGTPTQPEGTTPSTGSAPAYQSASATPASTTPEIDTLSATNFGNGDTITIYGKNFSSRNTVLLSIDFSDAFVGVPSSDGTSITFTPELSLSKELSGNLANLDAATKARVLASIAANAIGGTSEFGGYYIPATLRISNENGTSNAVKVNIDVLKNI